MFSARLTVSAVFLLPAVAAAAPVDRPGESAKIVREIRIINLVNGLELEKARAELILRNARQAGRLAAGFDAALETEGRANLEVLNELRSVFDEARRMSDAGFAVGKAALVKKIKARFELPKPPIDIAVKVGRFLLDPAAIPNLEERPGRVPDAR